MNFRRNGTRNTNRQGSYTNTSNPLPDPTNEANISSSEYARRRKELMELERGLRNLGAGTLIGLPSIVVIGGQSAGKSSLVEAISGINVPRESGTCTRCPMECALSSFADSWTCKISLRFDYDDSGNPMHGGLTHQFGPPLTSKSQFEISLRRAQAAILNRHLPPETFLQKTAEELRIAALSDPNTLKFSKNKVIVEIADPEATDLAFVDLPGLIQNEDQDAIDVVRNLVEEYIRRERTLILITIPMSDDMINQQAVRLAREADPDGERTIGVLTKPDTLTAGAITARETWREVLEGRQYPLRHGYYCVRLPDDEERSRNRTRAALQQSAATFFDSTPPWNAITDRHRLGIPGLLTDLSKLLMYLIEQALPRMKQDVDRLLNECEEGLGRLPAVITNDPRTEILGRITKFCTAFEGAVYGRSEDKGLIHTNRAHYDGFEAEIHQTAPYFVPSPGPLLTAVSSSDPSGTEPLNLDDVRKVIKNSIAWELPHNVPFEAKQVLILKSIDRWHSPSLSCFRAVFSTLSDFTEALLKKHFGRFRQLESHAGSLVRTEIDTYKALTLKALDNALEREKTPLFTGGDDDYNSASDLWLHYYKFKRRSPLPVADRSEATVCSVSIEGLPADRRAGDEFEDELIVMADVRGYFQVAHKRIVHSIPMTIEHSLTQPLANTLQDSLLNNIFAESNITERLNSLLSEDPDITTRRENLESKKTTLLEIREKLNDFRL